MGYIILLSQQYFESIEIWLEEHECVEGVGSK